MIKPALTPEEWADALKSVRAIGDADREGHILAALFLWGEPFGFTWEDVDNVEMMIDQHSLDGDELGVAAKALRTLLDRIAALLPPRATPS